MTDDAANSGYTWTRHRVMYQRAGEEPRPWNNSEPTLARALDTLALIQNTDVDQAHDAWIEYQVVTDWPDGTSVAGPWSAECDEAQTAHDRIVFQYWANTVEELNGAKRAGRAEVIAAIRAEMFEHWVTGTSVEDSRERHAARYTAQVLSNLVNRLKVGNT